MMLFIGRWVARKVCDDQVIGAKNHDPPLGNMTTQGKKSFKVVWRATGT